MEAQTLQKRIKSVIKGADIIIIGLQAWYTDIGCNCKSIAREFAKTNRVLYVNPPLDRKTILNQRNDKNIQKHLSIIEKKEEALTEVETNIWNYYPNKILESINWIPATEIFSIINKINNKRFAADIKHAVKKLNFKDFIVFNDNDIFRSFYLKEFLNPKLYIYYSRDNLLGVNYWRKHGAKLEPQHIAKADIAIANSNYLTRYLLKYNINSHYSGQGCNVKLFDGKKNFTMPEEMKNISGPVIGYVGALTSLRIDVNVIKAIAKSHPDYSIVLVGPYDMLKEKSTIDCLPNVYFLGKKPIETLPSYIQYFDVCINPQAINPITIGNYPLKIDEYLAMGKPIVATKTDAMKIFGDYVYLAAKPEDYSSLIDEALANNSNQLKKERMTLSGLHTWENSVERIYSAINKTLSN
ncbi:MAG TPA: glycosyltransferase [Parafilimonas sp.]|nr:glycosyltransferase [Parafilimonas sp.]